LPGVNIEINEKGRENFWPFSFARKRPGQFRAMRLSLQGRNILNVRTVRLRCAALRSRRLSSKFPPVGKPRVSGLDAILFDGIHTHHLELSINVTTSGLKGLSG
jgi:hypothetical protein